MSVTLKAIKATLNPDGSLDLSDPVSITEPMEVLITIAVEDKIPNAVTRAAMEEPKEGLPRFETVEALMADLES
jgi:hypothetical protein